MEKENWIFNRCGWDNNNIQFPRLIAALDNLNGFNDYMSLLEEEMGLQDKDINELINRAITEHKKNLAKHRKEK